MSSAKFITSQTVYGQITDLPEIAFAGRSNAGKSSLINMLSGGAIARTSSEPGRTRLINYFDFGGKFMLVDLPGYGFARASQTEKDRWAGMLEGYFTQSRNLKHVFVLLDIRHEPSVQDKAMLNYLYFHNISFTVIAAKADKVARSKLSVAVAALTRATALGRDNIIISSAPNGIGKSEILSKIDRVISAQENIEEE